MIGMGLSNHQGPRDIHRAKIKYVANVVLMAPMNQQREKIFKETENKKTTHSLRGCSHPAEPTVMVLTLLIDVTKDVLRLEPWFLSSSSVEYSHSRPLAWGQLVRLHCMIWLCNGHSRQNEESVDEDVVVVISGSDAKESILGLGSSCQHEPGLTAGYS